MEKMRVRFRKMSNVFYTQMRHRKNNGHHDLFTLVVHSVNDDYCIDDETIKENITIEDEVFKEINWFNPPYRIESWK